MAATSPYQNNDYQAVSSYRPYKLPINDIFKANVAIDEFWKVGARQVKKAYENVLDLKLRTTDNKQIRDQFIQDSQKEISKISAMNLADPDIQRQGQAIFSPIMKDQDIVGEDFVVRNGEKELIVGESFRTKDGGKNYNPLSIENIQFEQNLLSIDPLKGGLNKRDGWKALANNQSKYTPYADLTKEYKTIADTVKASELQKATISKDQWYINELTTKGVSKERMQAAIQEMGSPQLKEQMRIEGRNAYYKKLSADPTQVDGYFQRLAKSYYSTKIGELENKKAEIDYENYFTDPKDGQKKKNLTDASTELSKRILELETVEMPKYMAEFQGLGDLNNLSSNLSKIEQLWQQSSIDNLAGKLAYESSTQTIKANPAKIAQENLQVAYQRITKDYYDLAETKRHNLASEQIDMIRALTAGGKKGTGADGGNDWLYPDGNPNSPYNYNTPSEGDLETTRKVAQDRVDYLENRDEPLREVSIVNILGDKAWMGIQQNEATGKKIGEGVLFPHEIKKAAEFFKAYRDKYEISNTLGKNIPKNLSIEEYEKIVGDMNVKKFKEVMGVMMKTDVDFTADIIGRIDKEGGADKAANLRGVFNESLTKQINLSENITKQLPEKLAEYSILFDNNGKVNMTEKNITKAYNKGIANNSLIAYYIPVYNTALSKAKGTPSGYTAVTKAEYDKSKDISKKVDVPSPSEFAKIIRQRTDPVYRNIKSENNQAGLPYVYDDKDNERKVADINRFATLSPDIQGTDATEDNIKIFNFIKANSKNITMREAKTPDIGQTLPSIKFTMDDFGKDGENTDMVNKVNSTWFRVTGVDPKLFATGNSSADVRYPGAYITYAPAKMNNGQKSGIYITNESRSAGIVSPHIEVDNVYSYLPDGTPRPITESDVKAAFKARYNTPIDIYVQTDVKEVNRFIASYITKIEKTNKEIEEKLKNKK